MKNPLNPTISRLSTIINYFKKALTLSLKYLNLTVDTTGSIIHV